MKLLKIALLRMIPFILGYDRIAKMSHDEDLSISRAALKAMLAIRDKRAIEPILALLERARIHYKEALNALRELGIDKETQIHALVLAWNADKNVNIAHTLYQLRWTPNCTQDAALFYYMIEQWEDLVNLGATSIPVLVKALDAIDNSIVRSHEWDQDNLCAKYNLVSSALQKLGDSHGAFYYDKRSSEVVIPGYREEYWSTDCTGQASVYRIPDSNYDTVAIEQKWLKVMREPVH